MWILIYDTETTGLIPKNVEVIPENLQKLPHMVQLSYIIYNDDTKTILKTRDYIMKVPEGVTISPESIEFHGITDEISQEKGVCFHTIVEELSHDFKKADLIVAHNMVFDLNILYIDTMRHSLLLKTVDLYDISNNRIRAITRSDTKTHAHSIQVMDQFLLQLQSLLYYPSSSSSSSNSEEKNMKGKLFCTMQESLELCHLVRANSKGNYLKFPKLEEMHHYLFGTTPKNLHNSMNDVYVCLRCFHRLRYGEDLLEKNKDLKLVFHNKLLH